VGGLLTLGGGEIYTARERARQLKKFFVTDARITQTSVFALSCAFFVGFFDFFAVEMVLPRLFRKIMESKTTCFGK